MTDNERWHRVYLAAIRAGHPGWAAKDAADIAVQHGPKEPTLTREQKLQMVGLPVDAK